MEMYGDYGVFSSKQCSMYGIFTYIYTRNKPNVDKYDIHGYFGQNTIDNLVSLILVALHHSILFFFHAFCRGTL